MNRNDLRRVDLNLLIVFETLMHERSVTRAAEKLFLGQPAISAALSRLRTLFDDPLFVRTGRSMEPTARAQEIFAHLSPALDSISTAMSRASEFDPATSTAVFRIGLSDDVEFGLLPPLLRRLRAEAPGIVLVVRRANYLLMPNLLASGEISVGVSYTDELPANAKRKTVRRSKPKILRADSAPGQLTLDDYCARPHALVSFAGDLSEAAEADLQQLQVSLIAELVDAYGQLRGAQLREKIALSNLENQKESRQLTEQLRDAGVGAELDVLRADARLAATAASVPQLQAEAERARHRIATLLGQRPEELTVDLSPRDLPAITKALPIGDPGELLRRRPDIRAAERRLAASTADVGVATADLFPRVSLSGFLGFTAGRGSQIGSSAARAWSVGPSISWAAFDLGSVRARLRGAKADADAALASYEQQVLLALEESANAFSDYGKRQERLVSLVRQSEASRAAAQQAAIRYREGTTDFLVLLDAEREQLSAEDAQAQAEVELYRGIVAIYRSLGGGWQPSA